VLHQKKPRFVASLTDSARVADGDTLELSGGQRVRLWGVDAVEGSQVCRRGGKPWRCGEDATAALPAPGGRAQADLRRAGRDRYRRIVAVCRVGGRDIGAEMVREGWALDYRRYSGGAYAAEQEAERAGLWAGEFVPPWEWRHAKH
jgi:endonuclease YncB( thermonuclease family)